MKKEYTTPVITIEELLKQDVLLASNEIDPSKNDDQTIDGRNFFTFVWGELTGS